MKTAFRANLLPPCWRKKWGGKREKCWMKHVTFLRCLLSEISMQVSWSPVSMTNSVLAVLSITLPHSWFNIILLYHSEDTNQKPYEKFFTKILHSRLISSIRPKFYSQHSQPNISTPTILRGRYTAPHFSSYTRVGTLIVVTIYLQLIQNRYMFRSFTVLQCSHQHCVQPVASDVEVVGYL